MSKQTFTTPIGLVRWSHLVKPDVFKGVTRFKVGVMFPESNAHWQSHLSGLRDFARENGIENLPVKPVMEKQEDESLVAKEGWMWMDFKTQYKTVIVGPDKMPKELEGEPGFESKVAVSYVASPHNNNGGGISCFLQAVQIIELTPGSVGDPTAGFDVVDDGTLEKVPF